MKNMARKNMAGAVFSSVDLTITDLTGANLSGGTFDRSDLSNVCLVEANMKRTSLASADLSRANLTRANLRGANLEMANLSRADLREADLSNTYKVGANFNGAELTGTMFTLGRNVGHRVINISIEQNDIFGYVAEIEGKVEICLEVGFDSYTLPVFEMKLANGEFDDTALPYLETVIADLKQIRAALK